MDNTVNSPAADLRRKVSRDIAIIIGAVIAVAAAVAVAVLFMGILGVIVLAVATLVVGGVKEVAKVVALRFDEAAASSKLAGEAGLAKQYEGKSSAASEWSSAAALITWVLGLGAVLTAILQAVEKSA